MIVKRTTENLRVFLRIFFLILINIASFHSFLLEKKSKERYEKNEVIRSTFLSNTHLNHFYKFLNVWEMAEAVGFPLYAVE